MTYVRVDFDNFKIEKDRYLRIVKNCYLCHVKKWGEDDYMYALAVRTHGEDDDGEGLEIFGWGDTILKALISAVAQLTTSGREGISFNLLRNLTVTKMVDMIDCGDGDLESPKVKCTVDFSVVEKEPWMSDEQRYCVLIRGDKCVPFIE